MFSEAGIDNQEAILFPIITEPSAFGSTKALQNKLLAPTVILQKKKEAIER